MAQADRDEALNLDRFLRFAKLRRDVEEADRADAARRRLEQQLRFDAIRYGSYSTASQWRAA